MKNIKDILIETAILTTAVIAWGTIKAIHLYQRETDKNS